VRDHTPRSHDAATAEAALLATGTVTSVKLVPDGSNYTFLAQIEGDGDQRTMGIYKPRQGEIPLWDFPDGTLHLRERAAYLLAELLGWRFIPLTIGREGPYGLGSMQAYVDHDPRDHYFTLRDRHEDEMRRFCLFDWLANNADRKAGHVLLGADGRVWGIDHGLTFNAQPKLRTVIWDFAGETVAEPLLEDLRALRSRLGAEDADAAAFRALLHPQEVAALLGRLEGILADPRYPDLSTGRVPRPWL
jgi:uncharacterized repeat protein (TIGR03843 family)